ncbi:MAG: hypothetical protein QOJ02_1290 [Acidobacteriota bacterium]|nr:hypothetical protein [Acidobacteriota bacterium]
MDTSKNQELPPEPEREKLDKLADPPRKQDETINEVASLATSGTDNVPSPLADEERAKLQKEYDVHIHSYEFYLEYGLKAVAVFYAVIGGILSIYFSGNRRVDSSVLIILLGLPVFMSVILGLTFLWGAKKWRKMSEHIQKIADKLGIERPPDIVLLTYLLWIFGFLYIVTGGALLWLIVHWLNASST